MKPIKTLVLVADDASARLFENLGPGRGLTEIEDLSSRMLDAAQTRYADRPGRNSAGPGLSHHATIDLAEAEEEQHREAFVRAVVDETEARFNAGGYARLVIAAAPATLGALRAHLPETLVKALVLDIDKDFIKQGPAEVVRHLEGRIVL